MPLITAINPRKKKTPKKGTTKKESAPMAKKKKKRKAATKTIVKYRTRKNPSRVRRAGRAAGTYAKQTIMGINVTGALKSTIPLLLGALACKFAAKKFTDGGADGENWTWKNYAFGLLGGMVAAFGAQALFKTRSGTTQKILEGALLLTGYKIFINEIAPSNTTMLEWFGADDDEALPEMSGSYGELGAGEEMGPAAFLPQGAAAGVGDIWQGDDADYVRGYDGAWRPVDEAHRLPMGGLGQGETLQPVTAQMGQEEGWEYVEGLEPVNPTMGNDYEPEDRLYSPF